MAINTDSGLALTFSMNDYVGVRKAQFVGRIFRVDINEDGEEFVLWRWEFVAMDQEGEVVSRKGSKSAARLAYVEMMSQVAQLIAA